MATDVAPWLLAYGAAHSGAHFAWFVARFRHTPSATSESAIFRFHFYSACLLAAAAAAAFALAPGAASFACAITVVFAHGIYSLTFLELWTLAQISYSHQVLQKAGAGALDGQAVEELAALGEAKRSSRLRALLQSGLVEYDGGLWQITGKGRRAGLLLNILLWLAAVRSPG